MAVPTGTASMLDIQNEFGGSAPISLSEYYGAAAGVPASGTISINDFRGKSAVFTFSISANTANATLSTLATNAGWNGSAAIEVTINSGVWVYSTSTSGQGLYVDVANSVVHNYGKIAGMGGRGGHATGRYGWTVGSPGGRAIYIDKTGCTINNYSGAYIAGGGGGGANGRSSLNYGGVSGGGGGAGGGAGGQGWLADTWGGQYRAVAGGAGGGLNATGAAGSLTWGGCGVTTGGGSGGGGGAGRSTSSGNFASGGAGGGRILPGTGGTGGNECSSWNYTGGNGGSAGAAGSNGLSNLGAGGGGGWGAAGGLGAGGSGGAGGAAISKTQTYTLSNAGTIYGAT